MDAPSLFMCVQYLPTFFAYYEETQCLKQDTRAVFHTIEHKTFGWQPRLPQHV